MKYVSLIFIFSLSLAILAQDQQPPSYDADVWYQSLDNGESSGFEVVGGPNKLYFRAGLDMVKQDGWWDDYQSNTFRGVLGYQARLGERVTFHAGAGLFMLDSDLLKDTEPGYIGEIAFRVNPVHNGLFGELLYTNGDFFDSDMGNLKGSTRLKLGFKFNETFGLFGIYTNSDDEDATGGGVRFSW